MPRLFQVLGFESSSSGRFAVNVRPLRSPAALGFVMALGLAAPALAVPIGSLHCNDSDGVPLTKGQTVTVSGVVVGQFSTERNVKLFVEDATGAVNVFGSPKDCVAIGDSVRATGIVTGYNGLTEITGAAEKPVQIEHLGHAAAVPAPLPLTLAQVLGTEQGGGCEPNESRLVQLDDVTLLAANGQPLAADAKFKDDTSYRVVAASDTSTYVIVRVSDPEGCDLSQSLEDQPVPAGPVRVIGILAQYTGRSRTHGGYQLLPRMRSDIQPGKPKPAAAKH
jgi:hypothetical protein